MRVEPETVALAFGLMTVGVMMTMLRRRRMREKYPVLWVLVACVVLVLGALPQTLGWAAALLGVAVPLNLLYFVGGLAALLICVQFSVELSQLEERTRRLAEEVALLKVNDRDSGGRQDDDIPN